MSECKHLQNSFVYKTVVLFRLKNRSFEIFLKSLFVISIFINNFSKLNAYFDIQNGRFSTQNPSRTQNIFPNQLFSELLGMNIDSYETMKINTHDRKLIMSLLLDYMSYHAHVDKSDIKSLKIIYSLYDWWNY